MMETDGRTNGRVEHKEHREAIIGRNGLYGLYVLYGAVVKKDVPPWTVVAGNPAHEVKKRVLKSEL